MKKLTNLLAVAVVLAFSGTVISCGKNSTSTGGDSIDETSSDSSEEVDIIHAESITLDSTVDTLAVGQSVKINATVAPDECDNPAVVYSSSDTTIATVDEHGAVKGIKAGTATITCTSADVETVKSTKDIVVTDDTLPVTKKFYGDDATMGSCGNVQTYVMKDEGNKGSIENINSVCRINFIMTSPSEQIVTLKAKVSVWANITPDFSTMYKLEVNDEEIQVPYTDIDIGDTAQDEYAKYYFHWIDLGAIKLVAGQNCVTFYGKIKEYSNFGLISIDSKEELTPVHTDLSDPDATWTNEFKILGKDAASTTPDIKADYNNPDYLIIPQDKHGATFSFKYISDKDTRASLYFGMAMATEWPAQGIYKVVVNEKEIPIPTLYDKDPTPDAENYTHYMDYHMNTIDIKTGENMITMTAIGGCGNFGWVKFITDATLSLPAVEA